MLKKIAIVIGLLMLFVSMSTMAQDKSEPNRSKSAITVGSTEVVFTFNANGIWRNTTDKDWQNKITKPEQIQVLYVAGRAENDSLENGTLSWKNRSKWIKLNKDGLVYSGSVKLPPGRYEYKFVAITASGRLVWTADPDNPMLSDNQWKNSILVVEEGQVKVTLPEAMMKCFKQLTGKE